MALNQDFLKKAPSIKVDYINVALLQVKTGSGTIEFYNERNSRKFTFIGLKDTRTLTFDANDYDIEVIDADSFMVLLTSKVQTKKTTLISFGNRESVEVFAAHIDSGLHQRGRSEKHVRPKYTVNKSAHSFHGDRVHGRPIPMCPSDADVNKDIVHNVSPAGYEGDSYSELKGNESKSGSSESSSSDYNSELEKRPEQKKKKIFEGFKVSRKTEGHQN